MKTKNQQPRESLWVYYKIGTGTTRARLHKLVDGKYEDIDDKKTTDLAATIYKAWIDKDGAWGDYPRLLVLPRGIYASDGSGYSFSNLERDVSYHLINDLHYSRIMKCNGLTFREALAQKTRQKCLRYVNRVCNILRKLFRSRPEDDVAYPVRPLPAPFPACEASHSAP